MSGEQHPPSDAQELARMFGVTGISSGSQLDMQISEWLRAKYRAVYIEGSEDAQGSAMLGIVDSPHPKYL